MPAQVDLVSALRRYWGYDSFRPLQERIVRSILAYKDVAVVMPTGGGKSLCYQLPAVVSEGTAIVISPLIALMQDQAAHLAQMGIPAAILNSALTFQEQSEIMRKAIRGAYRLLYLSPERLARADTVAWLQKVPISFFAIDEAHCISEWGHEFRPEYRQLNRLRAAFPGKPIAAFTASATRQVRHDILQQLQLRDAEKFIVSFHRPNLRYIVHTCDSKTQPKLLLTALHEHAGENIIVYAPTIKSVEYTATFLTSKGIPAVPYHGQMETPLRQRNQEIWMSEEIPVLVGTLAFGLGINKPSVRAVIHLSMPKSIEQYYQEAGRAGRDGLPADCLMLWQKKDAGLLAHFIEQIADSREKQHAWQRYHAMRRFVESAECRHLQVCRHFGETPKWQRCEMCDVCSDAPDWLTSTRLPAGWSPAPAAASYSAKPAVARGPAEVDLELVAHMKKWRRRISDEKGMPAFMILHDSTLIDLCRRQPRDASELLSVTGIGERKAELYGREILSELSSYLSPHSP